MKKRILLLTTAALLLAITVVGGSLAATSAAGQRATSEMAAPTLNVSIGSSSVSELRLAAEGKAMPGDSLDAAVFTIENTADVPLYAQVTVTKYWTDETDAKNNTTMDASLIEMESEAGGWLQAQDVLVGSSTETEVYYYSVPIAPGEGATLTLDVALDTAMGNEYQNANVLLEASVKAVQYAAGENELNASGILSAFGVVATLNGDGSIAAVMQ